jgi:hypothetical protein
MNSSVDMLKNIGTNLAKNDLSRYSIPRLFRCGYLNNLKNNRIIKLKKNNATLRLAEEAALIRGLLYLPKNSKWYFNNGRTEQVISNDQLQSLSMEDLDWHFKYDAFHYAFEITKFVNLPENLFYFISNKDSKFDIHYEKHTTINYQNFKNYSIEKKNVNQFAPGNFPSHEPGNVPESISTLKTKLGNCIATDLNIESYLIILCKNIKTILQNETTLVDTLIHSNLKLIYVLDEFVGFIFLFDEKFSSVIPTKPLSESQMWYKYFYFIHYFTKGTNILLGMALGIE